jgi:hypothetical protein
MKRKNWMKKDNNSVLSFFREIAIVVIGVLIAVSLNNLKEKYDNEAYIKKTLTAIENEIVQNKEAINETLELHLALIDTISQMEPDETETLGDLIGRLGGVQAPTVRNIGLRFFIANKAELVDYNIISQLSQIESNSTTLKAKIDRMIDFVYEEINSTDNNSKELFVMHLLNVMDTEQALVELYSIFVEENGEYLKVKE